MSQETCRRHERSLYALGWRAKGIDMTTSSTAGGLASSQSALLPLALARPLGRGTLRVDGFAQRDVLHNAGHDYRHSMAFPCH